VRRALLALRLVQPLVPARLGLLARPVPWVLWAVLRALVLVALPVHSGQLRAAVRREASVLRVVRPVVLAGFRNP